MKLSDLRPCDGCGGPLILPPGRWFHVVRTSGAIVTNSALEILRAAVRQGVPLERLEAAQRPGAVEVLGDADPALADELLLCVDCYNTTPLAGIVVRWELRAPQGRAS